MTNENKLSYVLIEPCGCVIGACSGSNPKDVAETLKDWLPHVSRGASVERKSAEWVRENWGHCEKHQPEPELQMALI